MFDLFWFPGYGILSEETGEEGSAEDRWIIDPLDGTRSFIRGLPFFGSLIALEKNGILELGVMTLPVFGETVHALRGKGCFRNGKRARTSATKKLSDAFVCLEIKRSNAEGFGHGLLELAEKCSYTRGYSDVYAYFLVATGQVDAFIEGFPCAWDVAAPKVCLEEAGGELLKVDGKKAGLAVATNCHLTKEIMKILGK
ncbi:inositol monophosphatase [Candidatus Micrarchaeota archaeon]|nr:inositol monophosphatase [Candidatus Micrarchaeota archaeon]